MIEEPFPGTPFFGTIGKEFDYYGDEPVQVAVVKEEAERIWKEVFYIPALAVLAFVMVSQKRRQRREQQQGAPAAA